MLTNFKELENYVLSQNMKKRIALANAHDEPALSAVVNAHRKGVVEGTLVGKKDEIIAMLHEMGMIENVLRLPLVPTRLTTMERISQIVRELGY